MPVITPYDSLRELDDVFAIPLYMLFEVWNIAVGGAAGPVAVTVGVHMTGLSAPKGAESIAYGTTVIALLVLSILSTVFKLDAIPLGRLIPKPKRPQRRMVSNRREQRGYVTKTSHWEMGSMDCFGGGVVGAVLTTLVVLVVVLIVGAVALALVLAFGAGVAALFTKLLTGDVPVWTLLASLPVSPMMLLPAGTMNGKSTRGPYEIITGAVGGVIFAKLAEVQGHPICALGVGAGAGAAAGTMLWVGKMPINLLNGTFSRHYQSWPRDEYVSDNNYWARRLFPPLRDVAVNKVAIEARVAEQEAARAWKKEEEELTLHPEQHKVFWSRPMGIDKVSHYVLIVNGQKYELRDVSERRDRSRIEYRTAKVAFAPPRRHATVLSEPENPTSTRGVYDLLLIGWTAMTHQQIDAICSQVDRKWKYSIGFGGANSGNCQHFVRKVADEIIPKNRRAANWEWFRNDRMGPIQHLQDVLIRRQALLEQQAREEADEMNLPMSGFSGGL